MTKSRRKRVSPAGSGLPARSGAPARSALPGSGEDRPDTTPGAPVWIRRDELVEDWDRYFELFVFAPIGYALVDLKGVILEINQAGRELLGAQGGTVIGRPLVTFVAKDHRRSYLDHMRRVRAGDDTIETELTLHPRAGDAVPVLLSTRRSPRREQDICWTVIVDQTERRRLTEATRRAELDRMAAEQERHTARARSEAKDRFLATLSHELRTPLTPTLFAASMLLQSEQLPAGAASMVEMIRRNIEIEARLIDDLLDVTRIIRNRMQLERTVLDVHVVLEDCLGICQSSTASEQVTFEFRPEAGQSRLKADPIRIRQVFWNLLSNALKFTPAGGRVSVSTTNTPEGCLLVRIEDTGIGMDPDTIETLFAAFERAPGASSGRGLGLGLAICKGIVDAHGGEIRATSAGRGHGSAFEVELRNLASETARDEDDEPAEAPPERIDAGGYRVLIVEDHEDTADMLSMWLSHHGHTVETAPTLEAATAKAAQRWDVILCDLGLPDGSGLDLARCVRSQRRQPRCLIAVSGFGSESDLEASRDAGFDLHLTKPVDISRLSNILESLGE